MKSVRVTLSVGLVGAAALGSIAEAATVPFTEDFVADVAGWRDVISAELTWVSSGGPDGGSYASGTFNFSATSEGDQLAMFRAHDEWDSSGGAFVGDYIFDRVGRIQAYVRHDAGVPITFYFRLASPLNFPGAAAVYFVPVPSGVWTQLDVPLHLGSPNIVTFEGTDYRTVFSNIGHVQIGFDVPASLAGANQDVAFDVDKVTITAMTVPAVSEWGLAVMALLTVTAGTLAIRRRRDAATA